VLESVPGAKMGPLTLIAGLDTKLAAHVGPDDCVQPVVGSSWHRVEDERVAAEHARAPRR